MTNEEMKAKVLDYVQSRGGVLLREYKNAKTKIKILGSCGHTFEIGYNSLKIREKDTMLCQICNARDSQKPLSKEAWVKRGENIGMKFKEYKGDRLIFVGTCGHEVNLSQSTFQKRISAKEGRCRNCITNSKRDFTKLNVKRIIREGGGKMLSISDDNKLVKLKYKCGHEAEVTSENIKHRTKKYGYLLCPECSIKEHKPESRESSQEKEVLTFVRSLGCAVKSNYRENYPCGLEIDMYVPDKKVGFEFNGVYWHSEAKGKGKNYHINKTKHFSESGISLFQFLDIEWNRKKAIVMSMIKARLHLNTVRFYARKCNIIKINAKEARSFFNENHIQGGVGATQDTYALSAGGAVVAAMSFRRTAGLDKDTIELYRYATILNSTVVGGFSRLLSAFKKETKFTKVITYADYRFSSINSDNTVYGKNGFTFLRSSPPNYKYFKDSKTLLDRRKFQKHKLKDILETFDETKTEVENMRENGYERIFDCGNAVYKLCI